MADYNAAKQTATSQTQGWYNAEKTNREANKSKAQLALNEVDPYFQTLFDTLGKNKQKSYDSMVSSAIRRGVNRGGIRTRMEGNLNTEYETLGQNLGQEQRRTKEARQLEYDTADKTLGSLQSEWDDKVNTLAYQIFNAEREREAAIEAARIQASAYSNYGGGGGGGGGGTANTGPTFASALNDAGRTMLTSGMTREQMAASLADTYGLDEGTVRGKIYEKYYDGWEADWVKKYMKAAGLKTTNFASRYRDIIGGQLSSGKYLPVSKGGRYTGPESLRI